MPEEPPIDEEEIKKAEEYKDKGNQNFKSKWVLADVHSDCLFDEALDSYTDAILRKVPHKKKAIYYCNRALVHIKLENYSCALNGKILYITFKMPKKLLSMTPLM